MTRFRSVFRPATLLLFLLLGALVPAMAQEAAQGAVEHRPGGEVNLRLPDLGQVSFLGVSGHDILLTGIAVCDLGLLFGLWTYNAVKRLPVHRSMA
ncbi:MAG TPA: hypothetical protein VEB59_16145, partial [Gemmatimonadales bacterium]|nr:hypothetical protein [Gemmatimonadales bacterium]